MFSCSQMSDDVTVLFRDDYNPPHPLIPYMWDTRGKHFRLSCWGLQHPTLLRPGLPGCPTHPLASLADACPPLSSTKFHNQHSTLEIVKQCVVLRTSKPIEIRTEKDFHGQTECWWHGLMWAVNLRRALPGKHFFIISICKSLELAQIEKKEEDFRRKKLCVDAFG